MSVDMDLYVKYRVDELLREAENDRLADQVMDANRRPLRVQLAERLRAAAHWLEGSPRLANA
jgi:hypothetical protein